MRPVYQFHNPKTVEELHSVYTKAYSQHENDYDYEEDEASVWGDYYLVLKSRIADGNAPSDSYRVTMIKVDLDIHTDWISQWKIASDGVSIPPVLETISASSVSPDDVTAGYFVDAINSIDA
ncbi:MAG: hypothetical protein EB165_07410, partial [Euryarchaeota archaeon]|nr:hypothetical protein [Euryarchaeota archaeon]